MSRPQLFLHIGQHKTGSKALQSFLAQNRDHLRKIGICYPLDPKPVNSWIAYAWSHHRLFTILRDGLDPIPYLAAADAVRRGSGARHLVLSAEDLCDMQSAHETRFSIPAIRSAAQSLSGAARVLGYDLRVVCYVRRQDHLLGAHYVQFIKGNSHNDVELKDFLRTFEPRLDTGALLACWEEAVGRHCIRVRPYEACALPGGIVPDFFNQVLQLPVPRGVVPHGMEAENRTIDRDHVEFIRLLNRGAITLNRTATLKVAHRGKNRAGTRGIAAWLSPDERCALLARHAAGNARIARELVGRTDGVLFEELSPAGEQWEPYRGLSSFRLRQIEWRIRLTHVGGSLRRWFRGIVARGQL